jgi:signal recognition particle GTPase
MTQSSVVSAKVPKKLKQELEKSSVNISEAIRKGLENALRERKIQYLEERLKQTDLSKLTNEQIVKDVRRGRERTGNPAVRKKRRDSN